MKKITNKCL